jgi:hypothetical protein
LVDGASFISPVQYRRARDERQSAGTGLAPMTTEVLVAKRASEKRDKVRGPQAAFHAKRDPQGQFREMDEVGRASASDRRQPAKRKTESGFGDQGDRKRRGTSRKRR